MRIFGVVRVNKVFQVVIGRICDQCCVAYRRHPDKIIGARSGSQLAAFNAPKDRPNGYSCGGGV
jgi:hypothetical protein